MINYQPFQTLSLGPINIKVWGLMFSIAIIIGLIWALRRSKTKEHDHILNIGLIAMIGGVIGSRLAFIIIYPDSFARLIDIFKFWQGGMISYGGFIVGAFLSLIYLKSKKLNVYRYLDIFAIPLALSIGITRIGCFLNHCHLGKETEIFWGINYLGETRHPISLYYSLSALLIMVILLIVEKRTTKEGLLGLSLLILYPIFRLLVDQFAFYQPSYVGQINSLILILLLFFGISMFYLRIKKRA
jgi:phosphatidylglycerol---prolipoprotein diacylglyceryl transferase